MHCLPAAIDPESVLQVLHSHHLHLFHFKNFVYVAQKHLEQPVCQKIASPFSETNRNLIQLQHCITMHSLHV